MKNSLLKLFIVLFLFAPVIHGQVKVADSYFDFSFTQGKNGWYYGYLEDGEFYLMTEYNAGDNWFVDESFWTSIWRATAHPNSTTTSGLKYAVDQAAIRRWVCTESGQYEIKGTIEDSDTHWEADGVLVTIAGRTYDLKDGDRVDVSFYTYIAEGTPIDIELSAKQNDYTDRVETRIEFWKQPYVLDTNSPSPNPMTWEILPHATNGSSIRMVASTANDEDGVEYYFEETSGNSGGTDSNWQTSREYIDSDLLPNKTYSYRVKVRDSSLNLNEGAFSMEAAATSGDYDSDSIPDWWEIQYYDDPTSYSTTNDIDGDQQSNLDEYIAGTNPTDPNSAFSVTNYISSSSFALHWPSTTGRFYQVMWSLSLTNTFQPLTGLFDYPQSSYTDTTHNVESKGFYQIKVQLK